MFAIPRKSHHERTRDTSSDAKSRQRDSRARGNFSTSGELRSPEVEAYSNRIERGSPHHCAGGGPTEIGLGGSGCFGAVRPGIAGDFETVPVAASSRLML